MPFSGVQGIINGWIKVNVKHVVFPKDEEKKNEAQQQNGHHHDSNDAAASLSSSSPQSTLASSIVGRRRELPTAATTADPEAIAIKRFAASSRKQRIRLLQRTVSHTDLLREKANKESSSSLGERDKASSPIGSSNHPHRETSLLTIAPLRSHHSRTTTTPTATRQPINTGKYLNESAFVKQLEQHSQQQQSYHHTNHHHRRNSSGATITSEASRSRLLQKQDSPLESLDASSTEMLSLRLPPRSDTTTATTKQPPSSKNQAKRCVSCEDLEGRLVAAHADIEYLRCAALRNELCQECQKKEESSFQSTRISSLQEASKRLAELATRHRRQIEQITREQSRWQQDMHFKLSKFAMLCKDLNEESATRKQEALDLKNELERVKRERDDAVLEAMKLRAQLELVYDSERNERMLRQALAEQENRDLERAHETLRERDDTIVDLSTRLQRAMETLESERLQLKQRGIPFPSAQITGEPEDQGKYPNR